jgi:acetyl esterase
VLTNALLKHFADLYLGGDETQRWHPEAALLCAPSLAALPPTWLATLGHDPLRDDGLALVQALGAAGVTVRHVHEPAGVHGCLTMPAVVSQVGPRLLVSLAGWLRETV